MTESVSVHPTALRVHKEITVNVSVERAFEVFAQATWWNPEHHNGPGEFERVVIEPLVGGRCYNREVGGDEFDWGKVLAFEPPSRLLIAWQLNAQWQFDPDFMTELEITFTPTESSATRVVLEHRDLDRYAEAAPQIFASLDSDEGWGGSLERFSNATR